MDKKHIYKILALATSDDETRYVLGALKSEGKDLIATDGRILLKYGENKLPDGFYEPDSKAGSATPIEDLGRYPNWKQVIPSRTSSEHSIVPASYEAIQELVDLFEQLDKVYQIEKPHVRARKTDCRANQLKIISGRITLFSTESGLEHGSYSCKLFDAVPEPLYFNLKYFKLATQFAGLTVNGTLDSYVYIPKGLQALTFELAGTGDGNSSVAVLMPMRDRR